MRTSLQSIRWIIKHCIPQHEKGRTRQQHEATTQCVQRNVDLVLVAWAMGLGHTTRWTIKTSGGDSWGQRELTKQMEEEDKRYPNCSNCTSGALPWSDYSPIFLCSSLKIHEVLHKCRISSWICAISKSPADWNTFLLAKITLDTSECQLTKFLRWKL